MTTVMRFWNNPPCGPWNLEKYVNTELLPFLSGVFEGRILAVTASSSRQAHYVPYGSVHPTGSSLLFFWDPTKKSHLTKEESSSRERK